MSFPVSMGPRVRGFAAVFLFLVVAFTPLAVESQQRNSNMDVAPPSDLARENMDYIAASAQDIEQVLVQQPGLLMELEHWMAKDATDHGQMVDEDGMTQQGIFDRLEKDLKFRAVATRLLQRYGYLVPEVNPTSQLARQQQLEYLAERQRLQQQQGMGGQPATGQQSYVGYPRSSQGNYPGGQNSTSVPQNMGSGGENQPLPLEPLPPEEEMPLVPPPSSTPGSPWNDINAQPPQNLQEITQNGESGNMSAQTSGMAASMQQSSLMGSPMQQSFGANPNASAYREALASGLLTPSGSLPASASQGQVNWEQAGMEQEIRERGLESPAPPEETMASREAGQPYLRFGGYGEQQLVPPVRPAIVHRPNPYADIPSLYDLYEQVSEHSPELQRFGMGVFQNTAKTTSQYPGQYSNQQLSRQLPSELPTDLPAGPDYVVGPGDGLTINLWGSMAERLYRIVDREGRLSLPEVGPVMVSGETLSDVQQRVQQVLRTQFRDVSADVSLARLRTVRVYVVGDVKYPGAYDISSLSTPLNALFAAGGPSQEGSLRLVKHYRGKELVQNVDLYDLLLHGVRSDLGRLENGDTILVPPVGPEVHVEGMVRRPAIYEIRSEQTLAQVLDLAGGILPTAALRHIEVQRVMEHEKRTMLSLNIQNPEGSADVNQQLESFAVRDGDIIRIFPIAPYNEDAVYLQGHVLRPGRYSYRSGMRLTDLISSYTDLLPQPAPHYAEIIRLNPPDFHPSVESFDLSAALAHPETAPKLHPLDTIRVFSRYDFQSIPTVTVGGAVRTPGTYRTVGIAHVRDAIYLAGGLTPDAYLKSAQLVRSLPDGKLSIMSVNLGDALGGDPIEDVLLRPRDRILVQENPANVDPASVYVKGEVALPGRFPLTTNLRVSDLVRLAGGLKRSAYTETADLTSYAGPDSGHGGGKHQEVSLVAALDGNPGANIMLHDGDVLTIKQIPGWNDIGASVTLSGEVEHPGTYGIAPGEHLSSVLERAGGFLPTAFPQAAVMERQEVRLLQQQSRDELIQQVERNSANVKVSLNETAADQAQLQQAAMAQHEQVLKALRGAPVSGRLVIHLRRDLRSFAKSQDDIELRTGDQIVIPKRPDFVVITGQVYNSNAITYEPGRSAEWYLRRAGGVTSLGNQGAMFIIRADGSVVSGNSGRWWHGSVLSARVGPGDNIVVPEKPIGGSTLWKNLLQVSQIASSAAIAAAVATQ